jgi:hypothetical protein
VNITTPETSAAATPAVIGFIVLISLAHAGLPDDSSSVMPAIGHLQLAISKDFCWMRELSCRRVVLCRAHPRRI